VVDVKLMYHDQKLRWDDDPFIFSEYGDRDLTTLDNLRPFVREWQLLLIPNLIIICYGYNDNYCDLLY